MTEVLPAGAHLSTNISPHMSELNLSSSSSSRRDAKAAAGADQSPVGGSPKGNTVGETESRTNKKAETDSGSDAAFLLGSRPLDIPARHSAGLPSSLEAARYAVDPTHSSPGSGPVYRGRLSRRKSSFDSFPSAGSPGETAGSYNGRFSHGMNSTGDIQEMLNPVRVYHGKFGDTTGSSPPGPDYVPPELPHSIGNDAIRINGNVIQRAPARFDPFGPNQEYHGPLD